MSSDIIHNVPHFHYITVHHSKNSIMGSRHVVLIHYGLCLCVNWCMSVCLCVWVGGLVGGAVGVGLCVCEGAYRFEICLPYV